MSNQNQKTIPICIAHRAREVLGAAWTVQPLAELITEAPERDERKTGAAEMGRHPQEATVEQHSLF